MWDLLVSMVPGFTFGYPFAMAWYWMTGGILHRLVRGRHEPRPGEPPVLESYPARQHPRAVPQRGRERPRGVRGTRRGGLSGFRDDRDQRWLPRRDRGHPRRAGRQVRTPPGRAPRDQPRQGARPQRGRDCRAPRDSRGDRRRLAPRPRRGHVVRPPLPVRRHARGAHREPAHPQPIVAARPAPGRRVPPPSSG